MNLSLRQAIAIGVTIVVFAALPGLLNPFYLSMLALIFLTAYWGQAWNIMMGFAGQLSLGHAIYVGVGAYAMALSVNEYGISPWIGLVIAVVLTSAIGLVIGFLGFRFTVRGVYFALLTIAFAEFFRVLFENWSYVGGTGGYFLPAVTRENEPLVTLRGDTVWFYYVFLVLMVAGTALAAVLRYSRVGYYWLAIREDEDAARSLGVPAFRLKLVAVAVSAGMTGLGGAMFGLMQGALFPESMMHMERSITLIIAPIIGGLGSLFGPWVGAFFVVAVEETARHFGQSAGVYGLNFVLYGLVVMLVIIFMPAGIWPWICQRLGIGGGYAPNTPGRLMKQQMRREGGG